MLKSPIQLTWGKCKKFVKNNSIKRQKDTFWGIGSAREAACKIIETFIQQFLRYSWDGQMIKYHKIKWRNYEIYEDSAFLMISYH